MKKIIISLLLIGLAITTAIVFLSSNETELSNLEKLKEKYSVPVKPSVNHSKFAVLQKNFSSLQQVTETCISCHTERHTEVMQSNHWNWEREEYVEGRGIVYLGKKNAVNNFCIGVEGNEQSCAKCHIGSGMSDSQTFEYTDPTNIDCLVCHDQTESYIKATEKGGAPLPNLNLSFISQNVGKPKRSNCGVCHFYGGGGNNVKHGDLEESMFEPTKEVDVHMGTDASNLSCIACHTSEKHVMKGKLYSLSSMNKNRALCEDCHTSNAHQDEILNKHTLKVACQTCHIPVYAKVNATKTDWDWSTAGKLKNGEPYEIDDEDGNHTFLSIKGTFKWGKNLTPEYVWFNGTANHYLLGDQIADTTKPVVLNKLNGNYSDPDSKIIPVKIHRARQPFDPETKMLIQPKLYSDKVGEGALWKDFDWVKSSKAGQEKVGLPFSGKVEFIHTEMYWPVNHMVSSKENTVQCNECHTRENSRLAALTDFYMPARDFNPFVEFAGKAVIIISFIGIIVHGSMRFVSSRKMKKRG